MRARLSAKCPAPPNPAAVASRSRDADTPRASPASEHRSAESTESLPGHGGCRSTGGHHGDSCAVSGARARFSSTAIRSATDQTAPSALLTLLIAHSGKLNHHSFKHLSWVMQQLLQRIRSSTPHSAGGSPTWNGRTNCLRHCRRDNLSKKLLQEKTV